MIIIARKIIWNTCRTLSDRPRIGFYYLYKVYPIRFDHWSKQRNLPSTHGRKTISSTKHSSRFDFPGYQPCGLQNSYKLLLLQTATFSDTTEEGEGHPMEDSSSLFDYIRALKRTRVSWKCIQVFLQRTSIRSPRGDSCWFVACFMTRKHCNDFSRLPVRARIFKTTIMKLRHLIEDSYRDRMKLLASASKQPSFLDSI